MSYLDFVIRKKHKYLRNILRESKLKEPATLKSLNSYYDVLTRFVKISILLALFNLSDSDLIVHKNLQKFCQTGCGEHDNFNELLDHVKKLDIKETSKNILILTL